MGADPRRARVLQRRGGRADRRDVLGEPRPEVGEAAATLGATARASPRDHGAAARTRARGAAAIVFLFSFTSFGVVLILGGPRYATVEAEIYNQAVRLFDLRAAAGLDRAAGLRRRGRLGRDAPRATLVVTGQLRPESEVLRAPRTTRDKLVVGASLGGLALFLGLPLAVLVERSLAVGAATGSTRTELSAARRASPAAPWEAVLNSVVYAAAAALIAVAVGGLAAFALATSRGRILDSSGPAAARRFGGHARARF